MRQAPQACQAESGAVTLGRYAAPALSCRGWQPAVMPQGSHGTPSTQDAPSVQGTHLQGQAKGLRAVLHEEAAQLREPRVRQQGVQPPLLALLRSAATDKTGQQQVGLGQPYSCMSLCSRASSLQCWLPCTMATIQNCLTVDAQLISSAAAWAPCPPAGRPASAAGPPAQRSHRKPTHSSCVAA